MSYLAANQLLIFSVEALTVSILLLGLFRMRSYLGFAPLYVTIGVFQPIQVFLASSIYVEILPGLVISPGSVILFTASLFAILLVYIREDAIEARKVIYGIMFANLAMTLLLLLFGTQLDFPDTMNFLALPREIFNQGARVTLTGTLALFGDVLLIIFVYELVRRFIPRFPFLRIYLTMAIILTFDTFVFATGAFFGQPNYGAIVLSGIVGKVGMATFFSAALSLYLRFIDPVDSQSSATGKPFKDIFYALSYREKFEIERDRAEEAQRESEEKYRTLVESIPDLIYSYSATRGGIYYSPSVQTVLGYSQSQLLQNPQLWHNLIHPEDIHRIDAVIKDFRYGKTFEIEYRMRDKKGNWHWLFDRSIARKQKSDEIIIDGIATDITERRWAEEALRESEEHLKKQLAELNHIYNTSPLGLCFMDTDLRFIRVNEKLASINGFPLTEHIGRTLREVIPEITPLAESIYQRVMETGEPVLNLDVRAVSQADPDEERDWLVSYYPVNADGGTLLGVGTVVQDITERKQAENLLRKSEEKYRFLADNVLDALWILEIDKLKLKYVSPSIERIQGYTPEELMKIPLHKNLTSQSFELTNVLISEELSKEKTGTADLLRSRTIELEIYCRNGSSKWVETTASFIRDEKNNITGIIGVIRDISERKYTEEEKKKLETQLQQAQKMEAIGTLAGGIAHDFNNILSAVFGYTELALGDAKKGTIQDENLQEVLTAANRAKDLVKQILTFSRQVDQEHKPVQVKLIVIEALKLLRASIPSTIEIERNLKSNALVLGDSTQIHQIIMNLCTNAAHAMEEKGGVLTMSLSDAELDSEFITNHPELKPGPYINLTVTDTGHGMFPAVLEKIFDPFFTTKEKGAGTGMGLSVAHGIVNSHGGAIYADSEPGKGSSFKVFLPIIERRLKPEAGIEQPIPTGTERILFIDDESAIVNMGKQILESLGYDVVTKTSSIEALELFEVQKDRFDLVVTDMTMPQMTGENLASELFRIRPDIPVILCTGFSSKMDEKRATALGIQAFISKPILKGEIAEVIRAVLDGK